MKAYPRALFAGACLLVLPAWTQRVIEEGGGALAPAEGRAASLSSSPTGGVSAPSAPVEGVSPAPLPPSQESVESPWHAPTREGMAPLAPALEARVQKLGKEIRCPMCQGLSVADSGSSSARAQMDKIRELVAQGHSDEAIRDFFVSRYGEWALLEPVKSGFNLVLYAAPFLLLGLGLGVVLWRRKKPSPLEALPPSPPGEDKRLARIYRDMDAPPLPPPQGEEALALHARYETLLAQLREQREEQPLLSPAEAEKEKAQLLQEAAACLEAWERVAPSPPMAPSSSPPRPPPASLQKRLWLTALGGLLVGGFSVLVYVQLLGQVAPPSPQAMPPHAEREDRALMEAFEYFQANPGDLDGAAYLSKLLIQRGQLEDAAVLVQAASRKDPLHLPFRIYRCLFEGVGSHEPQVTRARADELAKLFASYDGAHEAAYWAAALYSILEDKPKALAMLQAYKAQAPLEELPPQLEQLIAENQPSPAP